MLIRLISPIVVVILLVHVTPCFAQEDFADEAASLGLEDVTENVKPMIRLVLREGRLELLGNWDLQKGRANIDFDKEQRKKELVKQFIERGLPEEHAEKMAEHRLQFGMEANQGTIAKAFFRLADALGAGGRGSSGSMQVKAYDFSGRINAVARISDERRFFAFANRNQTVDYRLEDSDDRLRFRFFCDSGMIELLQTETKIRVITIYDDQPRVFAASNYHQLLKQNPVWVKSTLLPVFKMLGIAAPLSLADKQVAQQAVEMIQSATEDEQDVITLLEDLASDSLSARKAAETKLFDNYYKWKNFIQTHQGEFEFDEISQGKLDRILKGAPGTEIQDYLNSIDIANNPAALNRLLETIDETKKEFVLNRLKMLSQD